MIAFGPVPSRRLGQSLGINNIPPKVCTYSCVYCQLGRTPKLQVERREFYKPDMIFKAVKGKIEKVLKSRESIDYLSFVSDGEPTLDIHLGREMVLLKPLGFKIAVISNASLAWSQDVREDLMNADWVSLKIDTTEERIWRKINRPFRSLKLSFILEGVLTFAKHYAGELVTETMLVEGLNDSDDGMRKLACFLEKLKPAKAYLSIPTRPPAEKWVHSPSEKILNRTYQILSRKIDQVEYLIGYEGNAFAFTGDAEEDILSITAVHPMREEAMAEFLAKAKVKWTLVDRLISRGQMIEMDFEGKKFYMRKLDQYLDFPRVGGFHLHGT